VEEHEAELKRLRGEHVEAGWATRSAATSLHPYQMVQGPTGQRVETGNTAAVLDGDLDVFMQAELEREATGAGHRRQPPGPDA